MFKFPTYMGTTTGDVAKFLNKYSAALPQFAAVLGVPAADVTYVAGGAAIYNWMENVHLVEIRDAAKAATDGRDVFAADKDPSPFVPTVPTFTPPPITSTVIDDGFVGFVDNQIKGIRLTEAYKKNAQIGILLGIAGMVAPVVTPAKGSIAAVSALAGFQMEIRANRYRAKTLLFYDMADAAHPKLLAALATATFTDERPPTVAGQSELRSYAVRYGDVQGKPLPNSLMSETVTLPTHP